MNRYLKFGEPLQKSQIGKSPFSVRLLGPVLPRQIAKYGTFPAPSFIQVHVTGDRRLVWPVPRAQTGDPFTLRMNGARGAVGVPYLAICRGKIGPWSQIGIWTAL